MALNHPNDEPWVKSENHSVKPETERDAIGRWTVRWEDKIYTGLWLHFEHKNYGFPTGGKK